MSTFPSEVVPWPSRPPTVVAVMVVSIFMMILLMLKVDFFGRYVVSKMVSTTTGVPFGRLTTPETIRA